MALGQLRPRAWRACSSEVWRLLLGDSALGTGRQVLRPNPSAGCLYEGRPAGRNWSESESRPTSPGLCQMGTFSGRYLPPSRECALDQFSRGSAAHKRGGTSGGC